ncbi:LysM peptidoglycan-binding domain-containing protein [Paraburkholderia sp. GAS82]|uniref:LysM peptidoglycan-binding domain-containing protein n=1 Tax=Paraburkholderia sp. GAS82 TaxID=3035137 RepID=UPI003D1D795A
MVAIVTGNGLGLQSSSALGLGERGRIGNAAFGQTGEQIYVNAATGNLMIQDRDELLLGQGVNSEIYRAYNSQGKIVGDNWRPGGMRTVDGLTGTLNAAGSTVTRTDWDGSAITYLYDAQRKLYVAMAGVGASASTGLGFSQVSTTGARATLSFDSSASTWSWHDGGNQLTEVYDAGHGGRLTASRDRDGNTVSYRYNAKGLLSNVLTASGDVTYLDYNGTDQLSALRTVYRDTGNQIVSATTVLYAYDAQGRLSQVIVDLSPEDNSISDGRVFTTTYTYDGTSTRIASVSQSDGSKVAFTYQLVGADYRVSTISQTGDAGALRVTKLTYSSGQTTVTDPLGYQQVLTYSQTGQLQSIKSSNPYESQSFGYDANGNISVIQTGDGHTVYFSYDAAGNLVFRQEKSSNVVCTYGSNNELLTETIESGWSGVWETITTRRAYDAAGHLRFVVSGEGRVTEFRYNAAGQQISEIEYSGVMYDVSRLEDDASLSEATMNTWRAGLADPSQAVRIDTAYDFRGNVASVTRYGKLLADGTGNALAGTGDLTQIRYVYDAFGRLLQRYVGEPGKESVEQFTYDGLGRLLSAIRFDSTQTLYQYDDTRHTVSVTFNNGLTRTSTYNGAGELIAVADVAAGQILSRTQSYYDSSGRLRMVTDANGQKTHYLYNGIGKCVAEIGPDGTLSEYVYTAPYNLQKYTITYATRLGAEQLAQLLDANGRPVEKIGNAALTLDNAGLRPRATAGDRKSSVGYLNNNLISETVGADGTVTRYTYDGTGRVVSKTVYANRIDINAASGTNSLVKDDVNDRTTRYFYDHDGLLRGELDPQGYLTEYRYDAAGQRVETIRYATPTSGALPDWGTIAQATPVSSSQDVRQSYLYDARGMLRAEIDGEGYLTTYQYDAYGNVSLRERGRKIDAALLRAPQQVPITFQAKAGSAGGVGTMLEVWIDGVKAGSILIGSTAYATYSLIASNVVPVTNHTIEFRSSLSAQVSIKDATFGARPIATADEAGRTAQVSGSPTLTGLSFTLDSAQTALSWANSPGQLERTSYVYDAMGRLLERTTWSTSGNATTQFSYDDQGRVTTKTIGNGTTSYRYDAQGRLTGQLSGEGSQALAALGKSPIQTQIDAVWKAWSVQYTYDAAGHRASMTDANGNRTLYYYDNAGRLTQVINPLGEMVESQYDAFGDVAQTVVYATRVAPALLATLSGGLLTDSLKAQFAALGNDGRASRTSFSYSATGALTQTTDASGMKTQFVYNAFGEEVSTTQDISGTTQVRNTTEYDKLGHAIRRTIDAGGLNLITRAVYDAFGRLTESVDANGVLRRQDYDRNGNVVVLTDGTGARSVMTYDAFANVLTHTDANGNKTSYAYSPFNREVMVTTAEGITTSSSYNESGQMLTLKDGRGNTTRYAYDRDGNLISTTDATGAVIRQTYDHGDQLIDTVDARGTHTAYSYDAAGRVLTRTVDPDGLNLTTIYAYDGRGHLVKTVDPSGVLTEIQYDLSGHQISVTTDPAGLNLRTTFSYDGVGNVVSLTEGSGSTNPRVTQNVYDKAGRLTSTTVDPDGLRLTTRYAYDASGNVISVTDAANGVTRYLYDAEGRQTWSVGPTGAVVKYVYDAAGRLVARTAFSETLPNLGTASEAAIVSRLPVQPLRDQTTRYVYDADGRVRYVIDALNLVTEQTYDSNGNVVSATSYAAPINISSNPSVSMVATALVLLPHTADRTTRIVYDAGNRLTASIDAAGFVTSNRYDAGGNLTSRTEYKTAYSASEVPDDAALQRWLASPGIQDKSDRTTNWIYDMAGRSVYTIDPEGFVTENRYDAAGRLSTTRRYVAAYESSRSYTQRQMAGILPTWDSLAAVTSNYGYDTAGRLINTVNAGGIVTRYELDALGRAVLTSIADGTAGQSVTRAVFDAAGRMTEQTRAYGTAVAATSRYRYDGMGRLVAQTDPRGVEAAEGDSAWAFAERKARGFTAPNGDGLTASGLTADQRRALSAAYTTTYTYNSRGELLQTADPLGYAKTTTYDAFGNAVKVTDANGNAGYFYFDQGNRNVSYVDPMGGVTRTEYSPSGKPVKITQYANAYVGSLDEYTDPARITPPANPAKDAVTTMQYDRLDRLIKSVDAEGYSESWIYDGWGNCTSHVNRVGGTYSYTYDRRGLLLSETLPVTSAGAAVVNRFEYDSRGNRIRTIEAVGLKEQRLTQFQFDALDRLIKKTGDVLTVYTNGTSGSNGWATVQPVESFEYDARGNLVRHTDANGNTTSWYYDPADHKSAEVSAAGTLSMWAYDGAGNLMVQRVYGDMVSATFGSTPPSAAVVTNVRETRYAYDANNRLVETRIPGVNTGRQNPTTGAWEYDLRDLVTRTEYDASGQPIVTVDGYDNKTYCYYDRLGRRILQIDAEGYATAWKYDAMGNVTEERCFAQRSAGAFDPKAQAATLVAAWPVGADDRITQFTWDRNGRMTSDSRLNVFYATVDGNGRLIERQGSAVNHYSYDGEGHLLQRIDANGSQYNWSYDLVGRKTGELLPSFADYLGRTVRASTSYEYDGLNNLLRETQRSASGIAQNDLVTAYVYGTGGRLASKTNANNVTTTFAYDSAGNMTLVNYTRGDADGRTYQEANYISYDAANRQFERWSASNQTGNVDRSGQPVWENSPTTRTVYNAYGEIVAQGVYAGGFYSINTLAYYADYDKAGRAVKSNFDRGIAHAYVYDANGNATLQMESQTLDMRSLTIDQIYSSKQIAQTFTVYDKRNQVIDIIQPDMTGSSSVMGFEGTRIGLALQSGDVPVFIGGGLIAGLSASGDPVPPVSSGSPRLVGTAQVTSFVELEVNSRAPYGGLGSPGLASISLPSSELFALYGEYDAYVTFDYVASNVNVLAVAMDNSLSPAASSGRLAEANSTDNPAYVDASRVRFQLETIAGRDGTVTYTTTVHIRKKSTGQEVLVTTVQDTVAVSRNTAPYTQLESIKQSAPLDKSGWLQLATGNLTEAATTALYYRPWGATSAAIPITVSQWPDGGSYGADLSWMANGKYEMLFVATSATGTVMRRDSFLLDVPGNASAKPLAVNGSTLNASQIGTIVLQQGGVDFYSLRTAGGLIAQAAALQYRPKGSTGVYTNVQLTSLGSTGSFRWDTRAIARADYDVLVTLTDVGGNSCLVEGTAYLASGSNVSLSYTSADKSKSITIENLPKSTSYLRINYQSQSGAWVSRSVWVPTPGIIPWEELPAEWCNSLNVSHAWPVRIEAIGRDGGLVYEGTGTITLGPGGQGMVALHATQTSYQLAFDPGNLANANFMNLNYRVKGSNDAFRQVSGFLEDQPTSTLYRSRGDGTTQWHWDAFGLLDPNLEYEYFYDIYDNNPTNYSARLLTRVEGSFRPQDPASASQLLWKIDSLGNFALTIHRQQTRNAFGEVDTETDGLGNLTRLAYDTLGHLIDKKDPLTTITLANGFQTRITPETRYFFDLTGNAVGVRDANGILATQTWNYGLAQASIAQTWQGIRADGYAEGGTHTYSYDEFGNQRVQIEQVDGNTWRRTDYTYDRMGQLTRIDRPVLANGQRSSETYEYDGLGQRIAHVNALGLRDRTYYDYQGRVIGTTSAQGRTTSYTYETVQAYMKPMGWRVTTRDANGRTLVDESDGYGRMVQHTDLGGRVFLYTYNNAGLVLSQWSSNGQRVSFEYYANGLVSRMLDTAMRTDARYEYDRNGNRTFEGYTAQGGQYAFQQSRVTYDELNRVVLIVDPHYTIQYEYDALGNRIHMKSTYNDGLTGAKAVQDYWYSYDAMNRFTVTMGQLKNGQRGSNANDASAYVVAGSSGDGVQVAYDLAGQRRQAVYAYDGHKEDYAYDANGLLTDTKIDNVLRARRTNDTAGRVTKYEEWDATGRTQTKSQTRTWDGDNQLLDERNNLDGTGVRYEYLADGTLAATQSYGEATTLRTTYSYEWWDSAKQSDVRVQASNQQVASWAPGLSHFEYDVNGHIRKVVDASASRTFTYWTDADGQVLQRDELGNYNTSRASHSYFYFGGHRVGNVGNDGVDRIDYAREMATQPVNTGDRDDRWKRFVPTNSADFDENYQPINSLYPAAAPGRCTVRGGDTFQSLAAAYYGDATLWYVIADANGLKGADTLVAGMVLTIPNKVENIHNTYATFKPYDAGKAIGDTRPTVPQAPPPPMVIGGSVSGAGSQGGCGGMSSIIEVVVAVVASVVTMGALAPVTAMGMVGAGAAAGGMGAAMGSRNPDGPQLKDVALGAMGGAVSGGFSASGMGNSLAGAMSGLGETGSQVGAQAVMGAGRSALTQGLGVVTGLQHGFDWKGVAAGAIASGAGYGVGQTAVGKIPVVGGVASGVAAGAASTLARGGSLGRNVGAITMDAVASTIGNMVVDRVATASTSTLYGPVGSVDDMVRQAAQAYGGDAGTQFEQQANWNLSLQAGLREQAFVGGLQDQFGQMANDALAASRAQDQALKQQLGAQFAGQANTSLAAQRAEHAAAAARLNTAGLDLGRGPNNWSDDALAIDLGHRGGNWTDGNTSSSFLDGAKSLAKWADRPIGWLENVRDTAQRGNAFMVEGLDAVGLHGLAEGYGAWGDATGSSLPTRPWEIALSAPLLKGAAGPLLERGAAMFGPQIDGMLGRVVPGLRLPVVEGGGIAPGNGLGLVELDPSTIRFTQTTVKQQGATLPKLIESMQKNGFVVESDRLIDVVRMPDGQLTSLDNTRILAAQRAGVNIQARVFDYSASLPNDLDYVSRFVGRNGEVPKTYGDAIMNRISNQSSVFRNLYPSGSPYTGTRY